MTHRPPSAAARALRLGALLFVLAPAPAAAQRAVARLPGYATPFSLDSVAHARELAVPRPVAYRALLDVLRQLQIPVDADSVHGSVAHAPFIKRGSIAKTAMSQLFDCGMGPVLPNATTYRLKIAYAAWVDSLAPDRSRLRFGVGAGGEDVEGPSKEPVACASTGRFEKLLLDRVEAWLR